MRSYNYIPSSLRAAAKNLRWGFQQPLTKLKREEFLKVWRSISYLYPGLHPDAYYEPDSGWPRGLHRIAAEAWRRWQTDEITDNDLYCYQAAKARIARVRKEIARSEPWLLSDHFAV